MATKFSLEHEFPSIPLEKFINHLNDPKLNTMLEKGLNFEERKLIEKQENAKGDIEWLFIVKKKGDMPAPLKKIIQGDSFSWQERSRFVAKEKCIYWQILPSIQLIKFHGEGVWRLSKAGQGCKRLIEGEITVDIPFVGKMIEAFIVNELKQSFEFEPAIQAKFYDALKTAA